MERSAATFLLLLLLALSVVSAATGSLATIDGELRGASGASISGAQEIAAREGAVHTASAGVEDPGLQLEAEKLIGHTSFERVREAAGAGVTVAWVVTEEARENLSFTRSHLNVTGWDEAPEVLAYWDDSASLAGFAAGGDVDAAPVQDQRITKIQEGSDQYRSVGLDDDPPHGFWYRIEGPWVGHHGFDRAKLVGDFTLFVHNATFEVEHRSGTWENWTGLRRDPGPTPGTATVESRVTVLKVTNGTLSLSATDDVEVYGPETSTDVEGTVSANHVSGALTSPQHRFLFEGTPLELEGQGTVEMRAVPPGAETVSSEATGQGESLTLEPIGRFDVGSTPGLEVESVSAETASTGDGILPWVPIGLLVLALAAAGWRGNHHVRRWWAERSARQRQEQEQRWLKTGDKLFEAREFEEAHHWYQRVVDAYPNSLEGWNSLAACYEELGRPGKASEAYEHTHRLFSGGDPPTLWQAVRTAHVAGQMDRALELAKELRELDEDLLRNRLSEDRFRELRERAGLGDRFGQDGSQTGASYV